MAIITISRQIGSFGDEIAESVAEQLSYNYIEKTKISEALTHQGLEANDIDKYDEKKVPVWQTFSNQRKKYLHLIQAVVYDFAADENTVIIGRGGQVLLKDLPGTLHVRIVAPMATRTKRLMEKTGYDEKSARQFIQRNDSESSGYINSFFNADWDNRDFYDLIINTRVISIPTATQMIVEAVGASEFREKFNLTAEKLRDLALTQKVEAALLEIHGLSISDLYVQKGVVTLVGVVISEAIKEACDEAVYSVDGIIEFDNQVSVSRLTRI